MRLLFVALWAGCSPLGELIQSHVEPGGAVTASLDAAPGVMTKALADGTREPMTVDGTSTVLVFGLVIGNDDASGMPAKTLVLNNQAVSMTITDTTAAKLSVHENGRSCAATQGIVHLHPDGKGHLDGDFSGSGAHCQMSGTLAAVPITH